MDKVVASIIVLILMILFGVGIFLSLKEKPIDIKDLERECLMNKAVENCNGFCVVQMCKENYSCQACCGHSGVFKYNFTEKEIEDCNITRQLEYG